MNTKKYTIRKADHIRHRDDLQDLSKVVVIEGPEAMSVSDGYHTMDELYEHRITLWISVCRGINYRNAVFKSQGTVMNGDNEVWRSKLHSDGTSFEGWFILGIGKKKGEQITYHLPYLKWDEVSFAETLDKAPEFDGHSSADVLERLKNI